ncbi:hypothetical protein [Cellulosimicrobium sp. E-16]|uniref:hypothetical protein n=1 Tax=Cellulosimicrobium sp. E-16 TaxID=3404049 RepID=UPI003CE9B344
MTSTTTTTRVRRTGVQGPPWLPCNRPPLTMLPTKLVKLLTEYDEISGRLSEAQKTLADYRDNWVAKLEEAQRADARANADAARHGKPISSTHVDGLNAAKEAARATEAAMSEAVNVVFNEVYLIKDALREDPKYAAATQAARTKIAEAAAPLLAAITAATEAAALEEWITEGLPYDTTAALSVGDLVPHLANNMGGQGVPATPAEQIIHALTRIAG